jgi:hypothetical protein
VIIASVKPGLYYLISENVVVGKVTRKFDHVFGYYQPIGYDVSMRAGGEHFVQRLEDLNELYDFDNYPGYNAILKKRDDAKNLSRRKRRVRV